MERRLPLRVAVAAAALLVTLPLVRPAAVAAEQDLPHKKGRRPAPAFTLESRIDVLEERGNYPCTDCHDNQTQKANPVERELEEEHDDLKFVHGEGRFWCLSCHSKNERDELEDLKGRKVSYDASHKICLQCHSQRTQDFARGGHGKRVGAWMGERKLKACVECHDPHAPAIKARKPVALPVLRKGLPAPEAHPSFEKDKPWIAAAEARGWSPQEVKAPPAGETAAEEAAEDEGDDE